jgi:A-kinase anchor protein 1
MLSCKSIEFNSTSWYDDVDNSPDMKEIQLGSNPTKSGFDFMSKNKPNELNSSKTSSIMENVIEEETKVVVAKSEATAEQINNISQSELKTCKKPVTDDQQSSGDEKKQRQALSERDSANHSPVFGVLEGSVTDEARSEGSTDSGKGNSALTFSNLDAQDASLR